MKTIETSVTYTCTLEGHEDKGKSFQVPFDFDAYEDVSELREALNESHVSQTNQTRKEDAGNVARENARRAGGHASTPAPMSAEEKAEGKQKRDAIKGALSGKSVDELVAFGMSAADAELIAG